jgi:uncharacterized protein involved in exopolysaccharide biosynthesis
LEIDDLTIHSGGNGSRPGRAVDPFRLRRALLGGKWLLLGTGLGGLIVGFVLAKFVMTSVYESTAVLKFEGTVHIEGMPPSRDALGPAADAVQRQAVLRRIADEVGFEESLTTLGELIDYTVDNRGRTVLIHVPGDTGEDAAQFARTVIDIFIQYHEEQQAKRVEVEIGHIGKRIAAAEDEAKVARRRYDEFRDAYGFADLSTEQQSMLEGAARLRAESELAVSEVRALEAQVKSLETQLASTPQTRAVIGGISPERAAYQQLRQELATARATLSESHPRVQSLQQQVDRLRAGGTGTWGGDGQLAANTTYQAIGKQLRTAKSNLEALRERQRGLIELAEKARQRVEAFSDIEGEASGLLAEVKINENLVRDLRQTEAALEDALRNPSSGFMILDPGSVPEYPVRNKMKLVVFGAVPLVSFGLALLFVLSGEFRGLRVQTPAEVAFWGNGPVLGTTSWPNDPHGLEELVAGLDDYPPANVLIVGGSPHEAELAADLAHRMYDHWVITRGTPSRGPMQPAPIPEPTPIQTPPPSGPYPVSRSSPSSALATRPSLRPVEVLTTRPAKDRVNLEVWDRPFEGQALRRAARLAGRVVVLVHSGALSAPQLNRTQQRLGREGGVGYIVVGLPDELSSLPDRMGDVAEFWR